MHPTLMYEIARYRQADLLREAERRGSPPRNRVRRATALVSVPRAAPAHPAVVPRPALGANEQPTLRRRASPRPSRRRRAVGRARRARRPASRRDSRPRAPRPRARPPPRAPPRPRHPPRLRAPRAAPPPRRAGRRRRRTRRSTAAVPRRCRAPSRSRRRGRRPRRRPRSARAPPDTPPRSPRRAARHGAQRLRLRGDAARLCPVGRAPRGGGDQAAAMATTTPETAPAPGAGVGPAISSSTAAGRRSYRVTRRAPAGAPARRPAAPCGARSPPRRARPRGLRRAGRGTLRPTARARRSRRARTARPAAPVQPASSPAGAGGSRPISSPSRSSSISWDTWRSPPSRRVGAVLFPRVAHAAFRGSGRCGWRSSRRELERLADRAVALVPGEEAVEDLAAVAGERPQPLVHVERLVEPLDRRVGASARRLLGRLLARAGAQPVDAGVPGQLREPGPDRGVVAQRVEPLVGRARTPPGRRPRRRARAAGTPAPRSRRRSARSARRARSTPRRRRPCSARRAEHR